MYSRMNRYLYTCTFSHKQSIFIQAHSVINKQYLYRHICTTHNMYLYSMHKYYPPPPKKKRQTPYKKIRTWFHSREWYRLYTFRFPVVGTLVPGAQAGCGGVESQQVLELWGGDTRHLPAIQCGASLTSAPGVWCSQL